MPERTAILVIAILMLDVAALAGCWTPTRAFQDRPKGERATLVGLTYAQVEARIGRPDDKNELADSNEAYWIYRTKAGTLSVHFENAIVVDIDPADFPVGTILE
ncbi:MAG: hypothetical protein ACRD2I_28010 [Vicinamibacterales bacterium]